MIPFTIIAHKEKDSKFAFSYIVLLYKGMPRVNNNKSEFNIQKTIWKKQTPRYSSQKLETDPKLQAKRCMD